MAESAAVMLGNVPPSVESDAGVIAFVEEFGVDVGECVDTNVDFSPPPSTLLKQILCTRLLPGPGCADTNVHRVLRYLAGRDVYIIGISFFGLDLAADFWRRSVSLRSLGFAPLATLDKRAHRAAAIALFAFIAGKSPIAAEAVAPEFRMLLSERTRAKSL